MIFVQVTHKVDEYEAWKKGFDQAHDLRKSAGEIEYQIFRYDSDPNIVVHCSKWQSKEQAKLFFESDKVKDIRKNLGVHAPEFLYLDELERGVL